MYKITYTQNENESLNFVNSRQWILDEILPWENDPKVF